MSAEVAVHHGRRPFGSIARTRLERASRTERPLARLLTFSALGLYGILRWATLLRPAAGLRLCALLALAVLIAGLGAKLDRRSRPLAIVLAAVAAVVMLALTGVPLGWLLSLRVAVICQSIGQGLGALPGVLVPYLGIDPWVRIVILLGAGVLLLGAGLIVAFSSRSPSDIRRAGAALLLITLAVVPSTLARPQVPYAQGLLLFALIAAFMWSERTIRQHVAGAAAVAGVAGVAAIALAPGLDQHRPWFNYNKALAGYLSPTHIETFDWSQHYGPLDWPHDGRRVLEVKAAHPDYWKAENLDLFNGVAWVQGPGVLGSQQPPPAAAAVESFTQTVQVTIEAMRTPQVIAAGFAAEPAHIGEGVEPGVSPGTWTAGAPLGPGDSYTVSTYSPRPSAAELASAGDLYPPSDVGDALTVQLPTGGFATTRPEIEFPAFHAAGTVNNVVAPYDVSGSQLIEGSPYAAAYRLASRLAAGARTPYAFVRSVERYLSPKNGFRYDQNPPATAYPLESFLFSTKRGYCQQFAGAMALLLRMGGVPARVATGFTTGKYDSATHQYVVSDLDAHAWVEVWFPSWGWVRFDPTPPAPPTRGGGASLLPSAGLADNTPPSGHGARGTSSGLPTKAPSTSHGGLDLALWLPLAAAALLLCGAGVLWLWRGAPASTEQLLDELERAHARCGRPLTGGATLASLEHRLRFAPEAAAYVRALRLARFAGVQTLPDIGARRALRRELAAGLGLRGWIRSWWGLPPRPGLGRLVARRPLAS